MSKFKLKNKNFSGAGGALWRFRKGFTLIELLVSISIIGIMAGMVLYALAGAQTDARVARTRGTIQKINEIVLQKWEEYRYRPVGISIPDNWNRVAAVPPRHAARFRMLALRDTMRLEMPDRITDLLYPPTRHKAISPAANHAFFPARPTPGGNANLVHALASQVFQLCKDNRLEPWTLPTFQSKLVNGANTTYPVFFRQLFPGFDEVGYAGESPPPSAPFTPPVVSISSVSDIDWQRAVSSAELLYLMVANYHFGSGSALEYFRPSEVGDVDGDGLLEFIDAWGEPIAWIRWPAGYPGDLVRYADDDAMDPLKTDWRYSQAAADAHPRTLVPLVLSSGGDKEFGVTFDFQGSQAIGYLSRSDTDFRTSRPLGAVNYAMMSWPSSPSPPYGVPPAANLYYLRGQYAYPDPFFTWDYNSSSANGPGSVLPFPDGSAQGFRANQLGSIPAGAESQAADNVTNHDIILEP